MSLSFLQFEADAFSLLLAQGLHHFIGLYFNVYQTKKSTFLRVLMSKLLNRDNGDLYPGFNGGGTVTGATSKGNTEGSSSDDGDFFGMIFRGSSSSQAAPPSSVLFVSIFLSLLIIFVLDTTTNHAFLLSLLWSHNWERGKTKKLPWCPKNYQKQKNDQKFLKFVFKFRN